jgi:hypothetical protein
MTDIITVPGRAAISTITVTPSAAAGTITVTPVATAGVQISGIPGPPGPEGPPGPPGPPGSGGTGADEVWIGTEAPTDPAIELWYDPDAVPTSGGGTAIVAVPDDEWPPVDPQPNTLYLRLAP